MHISNANPKYIQCERQYLMIALTSIQEIFFSDPTQPELIVTNLV